MKKIAAALMAALLISGCSSSHQETNASVKKVTITNPVEMQTKPLDMSGYTWLDDSDPAFTQITMEESLKLYEDGGSGVVVYSYDTCPFCNRAIPVLNDAAKEMGIKVYYVDVYEPEIMSNENKTHGAEVVKQMETDLDSILEHEENKETGKMEPAFYTPEVVAVKKGKIVGHHMGLVSDYKITSEDSQMNDKQKQELKNIYEDLIEKAAD